MSSLKIEGVPKDTDQTEDKENIEFIEIPIELIQYLASNDGNIQNLCRICLCVINTESVPLLNTKESEIGNMFSLVTSIQVCSDDGLPPHICLQCKSQLEENYNFKVKCERSHCILWSVLKSEIVIKDETCDNNDAFPENVTQQGVLNVSNVKEYIKSKEERELEESEFNNSFSALPENITQDGVLNVSNVKEFESKEEPELDESYEYLEEICHESDSVLAEHIDNNRGKSRKNLDIRITDSETLLNEVVSKKNRKGRRKNLTCDFCLKKFYKPKTLKAHLKLHHATSSDGYQCGQCNASYASEYDLKLHSCVHARGPTWKCHECGKEFTGKSTLKRHIKRHMQCKDYACERCGKTFTEHYALRRHARVHTGEIVEKKHACHLCDKKYSEGRLLAAHVSRHSNVRPCVCATCGKAFPDARLLASHQLTHSDDKPYPCRYCDKRFRHESTRNTHHRTHTGEKPYVCASCGKSFIQHSNLTLHMRTHTGEKPYKCNSCEWRFTSGSALKSHLLTHTGDKPYSCEVCGKRFMRKNMKAHMRAHTGERPFACNLCPKRFITAQYLRQHCRMHTGEKPYECAKCSVKTATKSHLVKHMKKHHKSAGKKKNVSVTSQPSDGEDKPMDNTNLQTLVDTEHLREKIVDMQDPVEVSQELVLQDERDTTTEVMVVESENVNYQNGIQCLKGVNLINSDNYSSDLNLVTVKEGEVSISSSAVLEGTTLKQYQVDQSLLQIRSSGGQLTISKITSKMTANF